MTEDREEWAAFLDRERVRDCIARLARGEDRRDAAIISACFWPDAHTDFGIFSGSFPDYLAWVVPGADAIANTQHALAQTVTDLDGDSARAETHVTACHRIDSGDGSAQDACIGGRYLDRLEKRNGQWRIIHRTMLYDWVQNMGAAADWTQGIMGMAFSGPHFAGRAKGDFSEEFFAAQVPA